MKDTPASNVCTNQFQIKLVKDLFLFLDVKGQQMAVFIL